MPKSEERQDRKHKQEVNKTENLFEAIQKQMQEHITTELGLLRDDLNGQGIRLSTAEKSFSNIE